MFHETRELLAGLYRVGSRPPVPSVALSARLKRHERHKIPRPGSQAHDALWAKRRRKNRVQARLHSEMRLTKHTASVRRYGLHDAMMDRAAEKRITTSDAGQSVEDMKTFAAEKEVCFPDSDNECDVRVDDCRSMVKGVDPAASQLPDDKVHHTLSNFDILANSDNDSTAHDASVRDAKDSDDSYVDIDTLDIELKPPKADVSIPPSVARVTTAVAVSEIPDCRYDRNPEPRFRIPAAKWQLLTTNGTASLRGHWTYELYRDAAGNQPKVHYCKTLVESEACAELFLNEEIIGFDMEWKPSYHKKRSKASLAESKLPWSQIIKMNASLIQLGSETDIGLFHIAAHPGTCASELMAPSLRRVLQSPNILKTGVNILNADGKRVETYLGVKCRGLFELGHLHNLIDTATNDPEQRFASKGLKSLAKLTLKHLHLPLYKGAVRCSDWSQPLNLAKVRYSASDAYVGYHLFRVMNEQRLALDHVPPLPPFAELCLPVAMRQPEAPAVPINTTHAAPDVPMTSKSPKEAGAVLDKRQEPKINAELWTTLEPEDTHAFDALRARRAIIAAEKSIAEYHVAHDKTLHDIARQRPMRLDDLRTVRGLGKRNIEQYGADWIQIVRESSRFGMKTRAMGGSRIHQDGFWRPEQFTILDPHPIIRDSDRVVKVIKPARAPATSMGSLSSIEADDIQQQEQSAIVDRCQVSTPDPHPRTLQDIREGRILSVLTGLRSQLARKAGVLRTDIVSDRALNDVARLKAQNDIQVESMDGFMQLDKFSTTWGTSLSEFIAKHDV